MKEGIEQRPLMTPPEVMRYLGIGRALLENFLASVPCVKIGKRKLYDKKDIDASVEAMKGTK